MEGEAPSSLAWVGRNGAPPGPSASTMTEPVVSFKQLVPTALCVERASRDALGLIPVRGARYCEALTSACAFGWYVYPLIGFEVEFDGADIIWTYDGAPDWYPLHQRCEYPNFRSLFDEAAPDDIKGFVPGWLSKFQDQSGIIQIWTGLIARTAPDWSLLLRAPANIPQTPGCQHLDGIVETDRWCAGLFFNIRITKTDRPIRFDPSRPYLQIQAVHRHYYSDEFLNHAADFGNGLDTMTADDWRAYHNTVVIPNRDPHRSFGRYAVAVRKRRAAEKTA
jgi:uncharacterized protein DUF6065